MMKRFAILAAAGLVLGLAACNKENKAADSKAAPAAAAKPGAVSDDKSGCCKDKAGCADKKDCGKSCSDSKTSPGAVSGTSGCSDKKDCSGKTGCSDSKTSPGAVSGASACPATSSGCPIGGSGTCPFSGQKNG